MGVKKRNIQILHFPFPLPPTTTVARTNGNESFPRKFRAEESRPTKIASNRQQRKKGEKKE